MHKRKLELLITGIALVIFTLFLVNAFNKTKKQARPSDVSAKPLPMESDRERIRPTLAEYAPSELPKRDLKWGRDPFGLGKFMVKGEEGLVRLALNGIVWDGENPYAIINDEIVKKGDTIDGNIVVEIREESVILDDGLEQFTLKLWQEK